MQWKIKRTNELNHKKDPIRKVETNMVKFTSRSTKSSSKLVGFNNMNSEGEPSPFFAFDN
jgi:hypothetical protein